MSELVKQIKVSNRTLELRISRPESLNAINALVIEELRSTLADLENEFYTSKNHGEFREDFPRVLLISGEGGKAFVAGADIGTLASPEGAEFLNQGISLMEKLENFPIPTIAVITGFCLGGGLELALSCDLICATSNSKLGLPEITLGIIPGFGGTQRLSRRCGIGTARRLILTGEKIEASLANQFGIVDILISEDRKELLELCQKLEKLSPLAVEAAKKALIIADTKSKEVGLKGERDLFLHLLKTDDAREGLNAFFEKRTPKFVGK